MKALLISLVVAASSSAHANAAPARRIVLTSTTATIALQVHPSYQSVLHFPDSVLATSVGNTKGYAAEPRHNTVLLKTKPRAAPTSLYVETPTLQITLLLELAPSLSAVEPMIVFDLSPELKEQVGARLEREAAQRASEARMTTPSHLVNESMWRFVSSLDQINQGATQTWRHGDDTMSLTVTTLTSGKEKGLVHCLATNLGARAFPLDRVEVVDEKDINYALKSWRVGRSTDGVAGTIQPGQTVVLAALFRDPEALAGSMRLKLVPRAGTAAVYEDVGKTYSTILNQGRRTAQLWVGAGALQVSRGDENALVSAYGGGVQYIYGISENFSLDLGLSWLSSGEAEVAGVTLSEDLYRVHGGIRYVISDKGWIPYARVGVGGLLVSTSEDDDSSLEARAVAQAGAGVTRYLADSIVIGAEAIIDVYTHGGSLDFMANVHVGFGWGGYEFP